MNLRTLLVWGMSASLLAACSGGTSSVPGAGGTQPGMASLQLDASQLQSRGRSPQFVGASVNTVAYVFNPGNVSGSLALSSCPKSGTTYTCTVSLVPNTYSLSLTLEKNATALGTASATGIVVTSGATTAVPLPVNPINTGPALSIPANSQFYVDGTVQTITATVNELDPAGDIITTFYGPVGNWPTLTFTGGGGTTGVTINGGSAITTPPSAQTGGTAPIVYNGAGVNANSLTVKVSDGTTTTPVVTMPFVSLAASGTAFSLPTGNVAQPVTFTESASTGGTAVLDTKVYTGSTCGNAVTFSPALSGNPGGNALTANAITINATATGAADPGSTPTCTLTVLSPEDSNLSVVVTFTLPSGLGVGVH